MLAADLVLIRFSIARRDGDGHVMRLLYELVIAPEGRVGCQQ